MCFKKNITFCNLRCRSLSSLSDSAMAFASAASSSSAAVTVGGWRCWAEGGLEDWVVEEEAIDACNANAKASSSDFI